MSINSITFTAIELRDFLREYSKFAMSEEDLAYFWASKPNEFLVKKGITEKCQHKNRIESKNGKGKTFPPYPTLRGLEYYYVCPDCDEHFTDIK